MRTYRQFFLVPDLLQFFPFNSMELKVSSAKPKKRGHLSSFPPLQWGQISSKPLAPNSVKQRSWLCCTCKPQCPKGGWPQRPVCHTEVAGPSKIFQEKARKQNATCNDVLPNMESKQVSVDTVRGRILRRPPGPAPVRVCITRPFLCGRTCGLMGHQPAMTLLEPCLY